MFQGGVLGWNISSRRISECGVPLDQTVLAASRKRELVGTKSNSNQNALW